jgi:hypothetical protein
MATRLPQVTRQDYFHGDKNIDVKVERVLTATTAKVVISVPGQGQLLMTDASRSSLQALADVLKDVLEDWPEDRAEVTIRR